jgi:hypothetical protein
MDLRIAEDLCLGCNLPGALKRKLDKAWVDFARLLTRAITRGQGLAAVRPSRTSRGGLLPRRGFLCRWGLLPGSHLRIRRIEGIFDGLACGNRTALLAAIWMVSPVCGFRRLWIRPLVCGPRRHIENAEAGDFAAPSLVRNSGSSTC